jgi:hypothetical protein
MRHIKLFESFDLSHNLDHLVAQMEKQMNQKNQPTNNTEIDDLITGFEEFGINKKPFSLTIDRKDPDTPFLVWQNPQDDDRWLDSGYADDYEGDFSKVLPIHVLAFVNIGGQTFAYKLTPEEKEHRQIYMFDDEYDEDQLVKIRNVDDLIRAFHESMWEMD